MSRHSLFSRIAIAAAVAGLSGARNPVQAQSGPSLVDQNLQVRVVASGLIQPTTLAFIGASDLLVLEKASGRVIRISPSLPPQPVLDLAVNSASERGLLGIALHPNFPATPHVFLYWTESTTLSDSTVLSDTPLLGNRVDRYVWNGSSLVFAANLIRLRAIQQDVTNGV